MKKLIVGVLAGLLVAGGVAIAQNQTEILGNMIFRQANPSIKHYGTAVWETPGGTDLLALSQSGLTFGAGSSELTKLVALSTSLTPSALGTTACSPSSTNCTTTATYSPISGLTTADKILIIPPQVTAYLPTRCPVVGADVSADNTLRIKYAKLTGASCTPQSGVFQIIALRTTGT